MTDYNSISTETWQILLPSDWTEHECSIEDTTYFESADGKKGVYFSTWNIADDPHPTREILEMILKFEVETLHEMKDSAWEALGEWNSDSPEVSMRGADFLDRQAYYRIAFHVNIRRPWLVRFAFHDYECLDHDQSKQFFQPIIESLQVHNEDSDSTTVRESTTVGQLLDDIRDCYLAQFSKKIDELQQAGMEAYTEPAFREEDGTLTRDGVLNSPLRLDLVGVVGEEATERVRVDSETMLSFDPVDFDWQGVPVRLEQFAWDNCHIRVTGIPEAADWSHLQDWLDQWFDIDDTREPDEHGFRGVVHFLSDPERAGSVTQFEADLGSAPVEALENLLDALLDSGATKIEIGDSVEPGS